MIPSVLVSFALLITSGELSSNKGKLTGTKWSCPEQKMKTKDTEVLIPAGLVKLEFGTKGELTYVVGPTTYTGTYALHAGENVVLNFDQAVEGKKNHTEKMTVVGNKLTMTDSDGTQLVFEKVKKERFTPGARGTESVACVRR